MAAIESERKKEISQGARDDDVFALLLDRRRDGGGDRVTGCHAAAQVSRVMPPTYPSFLAAAAAVSILINFPEEENSLLDPFPLNRTNERTTAEEGHYLQRVTFCARQLSDLQDNFSTQCLSVYSFSEWMEEEGATSFLSTQ
jgi:hypothetical protein